MVQKYECATTAQYAMEMTILWGLVVTLVCPPLATCVTTPETTTTTTRAFDGASLATFTTYTRYAQMRIGNTSGTNTVISLRFKTRISDGLLFYFGGPAYLAVTLRGGGLVLHLNTRENSTGATRGPIRENFNNGDWHQITVHRTGNYASLQYNSIEIGLGDFTNLDELHTDKLFIGGAPDDALPADFPTRTSFRGCIEDIRFASYTSSDPMDEENLYFHRDSFAGFGFRGTCLESLTCGSLECLDIMKTCNLGACECRSSYRVLSEDPLVCGRPTTYITFTDDNYDYNNDNNNGGFSGNSDELPIVWIIIISISIFVALMCLCYCVKKQGPEPTPTTTASPMTQTQSSEVAFDLSPPTYQEVVAVTDVNPALTEPSATRPPTYRNTESDGHPPSANQQAELSNHDRGVQRPLSLPSSTNGLPAQYEGNQVPIEGQRSPDMPPPAYDSFMQYSKTPPGSLEALDV